jgi:hypothetical protein
LTLETVCPVEERSSLSSRRRCDDERSKPLWLLRRLNDKGKFCGTGLTMVTKRAGEM